MKLRSGKLTKESSQQPSVKKNTPGMSDPNPNVDEVPPRTLGISETIVSQVAPFPPLSNIVSTAIDVPLSQAPPRSSGPAVATERPHLGTVNPVYGILYSMMPRFQSTVNPTVVSSDMHNVSSPLQGSAPGGSRGNQSRIMPSQPVVPPLTNTSVAVLRQQMDDRNHDLVHMLTNQMGNVINPIVQESAETNRQSAETNRQVIAQLTRLCKFLGAPQVPVRQAPRAVRVATPIQQNLGAVEDETVHQGQVVNHQPPRNPIVELPRVLVNQNQEADQVVEQIRHEDLVVENNLATIVEKIMARNGLNTLQRPTYASPLSEFILQTETPRGWKISKYTKFGGESGELTVQHIARYLTESGDMENNENLRIKFFPSSLTKAAFTWFTTLPANSIDLWTKLEQLFHEQFYKGHSKISLVELSNIKRNFAESIDDYLNRFRLLKARCFTQVPKHELVQMAGGGLDYSIRKKVDPTYVKSMSQLANRVRHLERLRLEKVRHAKATKEKVAYVDYDDTNPIYEADYISP